MSRWCFRSPRLGSKYIRGLMRLIADVPVCPQSVEHGVHATKDDLREKPVPQPAQRPRQPEDIPQMRLRALSDFLQHPPLFLKRFDRIEESPQGVLGEDFSAQPRDRVADHI